MDHEHDHAPDGCAGHDCPRTADFDSAGPAAAGRRAFLRATGLLGAGVAAAGLGSGVLAPAAASASAASDPYDVTARSGGSGGGRWRPDTESPRFTLVVMPDTQYLFDEDRIHPAPLEASIRYVLGAGDAQNVVFLAHLGDVTQNGLAGEYAAAGPVFDLLDEKKAAYSVVAGNHDVSGDDQRGPTPYSATFNPARFAHSPTYGGSSPDGYNHYHVFRASGREWLLLALDWRLSASGFSWANSVLTAHTSLPTIVTTHEIAYADDGGQAYLSDYGQQLWDGLIKDHDQIFLTLNGHYWPPGSTTLQNTAGNDVHVHITNYQNRYYGGAAMIRTYRFDTDRDTVDVATFSPWIRSLAEGEVNELASQEIDLTSAVDYFSIPIDFEQRFAKVAPVPPRPARPAREMLVRGTLAYWRFDAGNADGSAVADSAVVKDLTGLGNDLVKVTVPGSPATPLTWSSAFHPDQPGHGSLYFAGQGNPLQGAYLQTVASAPINAQTFERSYTVEAFFKLPADWDSSQNAWTAMLSRWGMSGEAGKSGGSTDPQEPIVTLSLSGDRELQWCVYPTNRTDSSTNWGHELPLDAWWHVAVVNDGRLTKMYVDGCELVRNPATPAVGLTTLLHSWLLGGYEYGGSINQIFHGYIGDVRIVNRALAVNQFMNA